MLVHVQNIYYDLESNISGLDLPNECVISLTSGISLRLQIAKVVFLMFFPKTVFMARHFLEGYFRNYLFVILG